MMTECLNGESRPKTASANLLPARGSVMSLYLCTRREHCTGGAP